MVNELYCFPLSTLQDAMTYFFLCHRRWKLYRIQEYLVVVVFLLQFVVFCEFGVDFLFFFFGEVGCFVLFLEGESVHLFYEL